MSYQVIARKYRPQRFADIVGQEHITRTLQNAILEGRLHHAYLFTGIRGIGKTTLARVLSKAINCRDLVKSGLPEPCNKCPSCVEITTGTSIDIQEIDGASNNGVDDIREMRDRVKFLPSSGKYKIYVIDEVHMLSTPAFNALLKTLEEPPAHVIFIFATTEVHKLPATVLSRCQRYDFRRIPSAKIVETLRAIAKDEGVEAQNEALQIIAREADGSMRDSESLFDQAIAYAGKKLTYDHLKQLLGFLDRKQMEDIITAITDRDPKKALAVIDEIYSSGEDMGRFLTTLLDGFHNLLVLKSCKDIELDPKGVDISFLKHIADRISAEDCQQWFNLIYRSSEDIARSKSPKMLVDVLLINMAGIRPVRSVDEILERLESIGREPALSSSPRQHAVRAPDVPQREAPQIPERPLRQEDPAPQASGAPTSVAEFFDWLKLNKPRVGSLFDGSVQGSLDDSRLVIKFARRSFLSDKLSDEETLAELKKYAFEFYKRPININIQSDGAAAPSSTDEKRQKIEADREKSRAVKEETLSHEAIREAASIFGAEVREIKVK